MANLGTTYRVEDTPKDTYAPLPEGWYTAKIIQADVRTSKNRDCEYLSIRYSILGPTHAGRIVFGMVTLKHKSPEAELGGKKVLGALQSATGIGALSDSDQLIGAALQIRLSIRDDDTYGKINDVKGYKSVTAGSPATTYAAAQKPAHAATPQASFPRF